MFICFIPVYTLLRVVYMLLFKGILSTPTPSFCCKTTVCFFPDFCSAVGSALTKVPIILAARHCPIQIVENVHFSYF